MKNKKNKIFVEEIYAGSYILREGSKYFPVSKQEYETKFMNANNTRSNNHNRKKIV